MTAEPERRNARSSDPLALYRAMVEVRAFEVVAERLVRSGRISGNLHLSIGQEAVAVGVCGALRADDHIVTTHRGHGHCLAKGAQPERMFAELFGHVDGYCKGRAGSMHVADPGSGILGATAIVGGSFGMALGAALSSQVLGLDRVAVAFFGEGAAGEGSLHEALNLAALWRLPVIFCCENNQYAELSHVSAHLRGSVHGYARAHRMPGVVVDGNDVLAVRAAAAEAVGQARAGRAPRCSSARPTGTAATTLAIRSVTANRRSSTHGALGTRSSGCASTCRPPGSYPSVSTRSSRKSAPRCMRQLSAPPEAPPPSPRSSSRTYTPDGTAQVLAAINEAMAEEMERDERVIIFGEDVGRSGGAYIATRGLLDRFGPQRVRDTPISEGTLVGMATGAAMTGLRPVVEIMFLDFITLAADQLVNHAAKVASVSGGRFHVPLVLRTMCGAGRNTGPQHGQSLEAWLAHVPGLRVVWPSNPADAKGLLKSAIRDDNPTVMIESLALWGSRGERPAGEHLVPIGRAAVPRTGEDLTFVSWGAAVPRTLAAAAALASEHRVEAEVIDLRSLSPLDEQTVLDSLRRTGRLVVIHDAIERFGGGAEIAALAATKGFDLLRAPVRRVTAPFAHVPFPAQLERAYFRRPSRSSPRRSRL